jgi:hypothetical protein
VGDFERLKHFGGPCIASGGVASPGRVDKDQVVGHREIPVCRRRTDQRREGCAGGWVAVIDGSPAIGDRAGRGSEEPGDDAQQRGLAGAVRAADDDALAWPRDQVSGM